MKTARQTAFEALLRVERDKAYSNLILDKLLSDPQLPAREKTFASALFYGVCEKKLLLEYNLARLSSRPVNELDTALLIILEMGLYQLFFADSVPQSAAVNESVKLCKANRLNSDAGFVNAVLHAGARLDTLQLPEKRRGKNKYLSIKYSCPEKIVKLWRSCYGDELAEGILSSLEEKPRINIRVNTLRITADELTERLSKKGISVSRAGWDESCLVISGTGSIPGLEEYKEGLFHVQDAACQICCAALGAKPGELVIDSCSAPGGKSFTLSEIMENKGRVISCDLYEKRLSLVEKGAGRLGIDIIETHAGDSSAQNELPRADRILCDVPCSGLGIIRRKPELRYKDDSGTEQLPEIQYKILCSSAEHLKAGGVLVYSTCTLNPAENGENIRRFLREHEDFVPYKIKLPEGITRGMDEPENELTLFPHITGTDGFFIAAVQRPVNRSD